MSVVPALILSGTDYPDSVYHAHFAVKPSYFAEKIYRIGAFRPFSLIFFAKKRTQISSYNSDYPDFMLYQRFPAFF